MSQAEVMATASRRGRVVLQKARRAYDFPSPFYLNFRHASLPAQEAEGSTPIDNREVCKLFSDLTVHTISRCLYATGTGIPQVQYFYAT